MDEPNEINFKNNDLDVIGETLDDHISENDQSSNGNNKSENSENDNINET